MKQFSHQIDGTARPLLPEAHAALAAAIAASEAEDSEPKRRKRTAFWVAEAVDAASEGR